MATKNTPPSPDFRGYPPQQQPYNLKTASVYIKGKAKR